MGRHRWWAGFSSLLVATLAMTGCLVRTGVEPTPTPLPPPPVTKAVYEVRRGDVVDIIKALGRVAGKEEVVLYFRQGGRLKTNPPPVGTVVKKGDVLVELDTGDLPRRAEEARIKLEIAQLEETREAQRVRESQSQVQQAAAQLASARAALLRAQSDLERLEAGGNPEEVARAQAAVAGARAALASAERQLLDLKARPNPEEVRQAELAVDQARNALWATQIERDRICGGGPGPACESAKARVAAAESALAQAQQKLDLARRPAAPEEIAAQEQAVLAARQNLASAQARLEELQRGVRPADLEAARRAVQAAEAQVQAAEARYQEALAQAEGTAQNYDLLVLRKNVDLARVTYQGLLEQLENARLRAPFDGVVTWSTGKAGEAVQGYTPVVAVASPAELEIVANIEGASLARVQVGQEVIITSDAFPGQEVRGKVAALPSTVGASATQLAQAPNRIRISFTPPSPDVKIGQLVNVAIITFKKENVILVPNGAVRVFGQRRFVQVLGDDGRRRDVDVEVGVVTDTETEITKGLREGMKVIMP